MSVPPELDDERLLAELGGDVGAARTLYRQAAEELPRQIYALREAIKNGRTSTVRSWSRLLAITLGRLLATVAAEAAYDLHRASRSGSHAEIEGAMQRLEVDADRLLGRMVELLKP